MYAGFLKENIYCIILYGSVARGEDTVESDIDLAVIVEKNYQKRKNYQI
ncbi:MAG: nucleotidyltransferase domain-containing protein [Lachnospiraceae bacterium]|nr:nucleotidyltransferase domain-containing protein [Lachnospiraceae bacterium]